MSERINDSANQIIYRAVGLPTRSRHSKLLSACYIDRTNEYIHKTKLKALIRFASNPLTRQILEFLVSRQNQYKKTFIGEIISLLNTDSRNIEEIIEEAKIKIKHLNSEIKLNQNDTEVTKIRECLAKPTKGNKSILMEILRPDSLKRAKVGVNAHDCMC